MQELTDVQVSAPMPRRRGGGAGRGGGVDGLKLTNMQRLICNVTSFCATTLWAKEYRGWRKFPERRRWEAQKIEVSDGVVTASTVLVDATSSPNQERRRSSPL